MDWVADRAKAMAAAIFASTEDDNSVSGSIDGAGEAVVADMLPSVKPLSIYGELSSSLQPNVAATEYEM